MEHDRECDLAQVSRAGWCSGCVNAQATRTAREATERADLLAARKPPTDHYTARWKLTALFALWNAAQIVSVLRYRDGDGWAFWVVMTLLWTVWAWRERASLRRDETRALSTPASTVAGPDRSHVRAQGDA